MLFAWDALTIHPMWERVFHQKDLQEFLQRNLKGVHKNSPLYTGTSFYTNPWQEERCLRYHIKGAIDQYLKLVEVRARSPKAQQPPSSPSPPLLPAQYSWNRHWLSKAQTGQYISMTHKKHPPLIRSYGFP